MRDWCFTPKFLDRFGDFFPQAEVHRLASEQFTTQCRAMCQQGSQKADMLPDIQAASAVAERGIALSAAPGYDGESSVKGCGDQMQ